MPDYEQAICPMSMDAPARTWHEALSVATSCSCGYKNKMEIKLSIHTEKRAMERRIARAWIDATVLTPDWTAADPDPALTRAYKAIPEFGGRILRVVHRLDGTDIVVVTVFFDRSAKR